VHNASIMNACGACGLQLYRFGETISIPYFQGTWRPDSYYERIKHNRSAGLHTLCLLDIKVKEPNIEQLARGRTVYEPPRYMTVAEAVGQLLEIEDNRRGKVYDGSTMAVGLCRVGSEDQVIAAGPMASLVDYPFGGPLHTMIICGELHDLEIAFLQLYEVSPGAVQAQSMPNFSQGQCEANPEVRADKEADDSSECMDAPAPAPKSDPPVAEPKRAELVAESSDEELEMCGDAFAEMEDALDNL